MSISPMLSQKIKNMSILCAMFVVLIHVNWPSSLRAPTWLVHQFITSGVSRIAVPFFFVVSGFFLASHTEEKNWWASEVRKRIRSLVVPFYLCMIVFALVSVVACGLVNLLLCCPLHKDILSVLPNWWQATGLDLNQFGYLPHLWYIRCLFFLVVISPLLVWLVGRFRWFLLAILFVGFMFSHYIHIGRLGYVFFDYGFSFSGLFYFSFGVFLRKNTVFVPGRNFAIFCAIVGFVLLAMKSWLYAHSLPFQVVIEKVSVPFLLFAVWYAMPSFKLCDLLTSSSFAVYLLHIICFIPIDLIFQRFHLIDEISPLQAIAKFIAGFFGSILLAITIRKLFPQFAKVLFGGR